MTQGFDENGDPITSDGGGGSTPSTLSSYRRSMTTNAQRKLLLAEMHPANFWVF